MARILKVISGNVAGGPATVRLPGKVPPPPGYRGPVVHDPTRCVACGVCAYVCVSEAITCINEEKDYVWQYEPARCTFCARCVDHCLGHALTMAPEPAPAYEHVGDLAVRQLILFPACPDCGAPTRPLTRELLTKALEHYNEDTQELMRRCERCRRRRLQRSMLAATAYETGKEKTR